MQGYTTRYHRTMIQVLSLLDLLIRKHFRMRNQAQVLTYDKQACLRCRTDLLSPATYKVYVTEGILTY